MRRWWLVLLLTLQPGAAWPQAVSLSWGEGGSVTGASVQLIALITVLGVAPGILMMITCFPFMVTVLSILRQAIGLQQSPPNMMIISLSLFTTYFVMDPVMTQAWNDGVAPFIAEDLLLVDAFEKAIAPFRVFMAGRIDPETYQSLAALRPEVAMQSPDPGSPLSLLIPSFLLSEIARAFQVGFLVFMPFLIIDLVVAAILMAMGMMMVPPAIVSLPFKLAFFVVADGWALITGSLVKSYF